MPESVRVNIFDDFILTNQLDALPQLQICDCLDNSLAIVPPISVMLSQAFR